MTWWIVILVLIVIMFFVMKLFVKTFKVLIKAFVVAVIFGLLVFAYLNFVGKEEVKTCHLDLCDCKCYMEGWDSKGKIDSGQEPLLCGINCLGEFGVTGCEYVEGKGCVETSE